MHFVVQLWLRLSIACSAISTTSARSLRSRPLSHQAVHLASVNKSGPFQMTLKNMDDMSVLATITVGNQEVRCIPDTGSSEQVVFCDKCADCGKDMYSCDKDKHCEWGTHHTVQSYGSGETMSTEATSDVILKSDSDSSKLSVPGLMLWLVTEAQLDFDLDGSMECIFGLGPAASAVTFARMEAEALESYLANMPKEEASQYESLLDDLRQHVDFMRGVMLWQESSQVRRFSFCMHPQLGEDGTLIINDDAPENFPGEFVNVPTTTIDGEDLYWQLPMSEASIAFDNKAEGCTSEPCIAIMDTGTSLIGAPYSFVEELTSELSKLIPQHGCDDGSLHQYPDFIINLGKHKFTLPPRSYVCQFEFDPSGDDEESDHYDDSTYNASAMTLNHRLPKTHRRMPQLKSFWKAHRQHKNHPDQDNYYCAPCIFEMDDNSDGKPQWLFGLPFFREYYTTFATTKDGRHTSEMLFAKASEDCRVDGAKDNLKEVVVSHGVQRINPEKLRLPPMRGSRTPRSTTSLGKARHRWSRTF